MIDYIVTYKYYINDIELNGDKILTIEDDIYIKPDKNDLEQDLEFERTQIIEEILIQQLKDYFESDTIQLVDFIPVNVSENLYRFTEDDIYFDKETYI
ncbi:hypothetical protein [Clostridium beijerinckii]|uniref:hypothetical protein n=1 Tax=Clostridium beijerinckii TaxID=1520 RepID=UPI00156F0371|nr:hypothetical protein [Clostridium beijerinckii]NRU52639.1 hypothetical protein [Clostridium beijerinckii]NYC68682.1 hypothetical protein [Clostridium beijerinckii]NYC91831.1 hypothetical protein [Clostridium beijerinckii]